MKSLTQDAPWRTPQTRIQFIAVQFLTFARGHFARITGCFAASHASPPPPPFCSAATGTVRLSTTSPVYSPTFYNCPFSNLLHAVGGSPWPPRLVIQLCTMWDLPINMLASFLGLPAFALRIAFRTIQGSGSATLPLPCGRKPKNKNGGVLGTRL